MLWNNLQVQQQKELDLYWKGRCERLAQLQKHQQKMVYNCIFVNSETHRLLKDLLAEQRLAWEEMERDELDMLLYMHDREREVHLEKEAKKKSLELLLQSGQKKDRSRSR